MSIIVVALPGAPKVSEIIQQNKEQSKMLEAHSKENSTENSEPQRKRFKDTSGSLASCKIFTYDTYEFDDNAENKIEKYSPIKAALGKRRKPRRIRGGLSKFQMENLEKLPELPMDVTSPIEILELANKNSKSLVEKQLLVSLRRITDFNPQAILKQFNVYLMKDQLKFFQGQLPSSICKNHRQSETSSFTSVSLSNSNLIIATPHTDQVSIKDINTEPSNTLDKKYSPAKAALGERRKPRQIRQERSECVLKLPKLPIHLPIKEFTLPVEILELAIKTSKLLLDKELQVSLPRITDFNPQAILKQYKVKKDHQGQLPSSIRNDPRQSAYKRHSRTSSFTPISPSSSNLIIGAPHTGQVSGTCKKLISNSFGINTEPLCTLDQMVEYDQVPSKSNSDDPMPPKRSKIYIPKNSTTEQCQINSSTMSGSFLKKGENSTIIGNNKQNEPSKVCLKSSDTFGKISNNTSQSTKEYLVSSSRTSIVTESVQTYSPKKVLATQNLQQKGKQSAKICNNKLNEPSKVCLKLSHPFLKMDYNTSQSSAESLAASSRPSNVAESIQMPSPKKVVLTTHNLQKEEKNSNTDSNGKHNESSRERLKKKFPHLFRKMSYKSSQPSTESLAASSRPSNVAESVQIPSPKKVVLTTHNLRQEEKNSAIDSNRKQNGSSQVYLKSSYSIHKINCKTSQSSTESLALSSDPSSVQERVQISSPKKVLATHNLRQEEKNSALNSNGKQNESSCPKQKTNYKTSQSSAESSTSICDQINSLTLAEMLWNRAQVKNLNTPQETNNAINDPAEKVLGECSSIHSEALPLIKKIDSSPSTSANLEKKAKTYSLQKSFQSPIEQNSETCVKSHLTPMFDRVFTKTDSISSSEQQNVLENSSQTPVKPKVLFQAALYSIRDICTKRPRKNIFLTH